jgi:hypothetical protein
MNQTETLLPASRTQPSTDLLPSDDGYVPDSISPARYYNIPGDTVFSTTENLPDDQRSALRWLHAHASEKNMTLAQVASNLRRQDGSPYSATPSTKPSPAGMGLTWITSPARSWIIGSSPRTRSASIASRFSRFASPRRF